MKSSETKKVSLALSIFKEIEGHETPPYTCKIALGEIDDEDTFEAIKYLESLAEEKIVKRFSIQDEQVIDAPSPEETLSSNYIKDEEVYDVTYVTCDIDKEKLEHYLQLHSALPLFFIVRRKDGTILLNNKYLIARPNQFSENTEVFEVLYNNSRKKLSRKEVSDALGRSIKKSFYDIVRGLGFKNELVNLFFPATTRGALIFRNDITQSEMLEAGISEKDMELYMKTLKTFKKEELGRRRGK